MVAETRLKMDLIKKIWSNFDTESLRIEDLNVNIEASSHLRFFLRNNCWNNLNFNMDLNLDTNETNMKEKHKEP